MSGTRKPKGTYQERYQAKQELLVRYQTGDLKDSENAALEIEKLVADLQALAVRIKQQKLAQREQQLSDPEHKTPETQPLLPEQPLSPGAEHKKVEQEEHKKEESDADAELDTEAGFTHEELLLGRTVTRNNKGSVNNNDAPNSDPIGSFLSKAQHPTWKVRLKDGCANFCGGIAVCCYATGRGLKATPGVLFVGVKAAGRGVAKTADFLEPYVVGFVAMSGVSYYFGTPLPESGLSISQHMFKFMKHYTNADFAKLALDTLGTANAAFLVNRYNSLKTPAVVEEMKADDLEDPNSRVVADDQYRSLNETQQKVFRSGVAVILDLGTAIGVAAAIRAMDEYLAFMAQFAPEHRTLASTAVTTTEQVVLTVAAQKLVEAGVFRFANSRVGMFCGVNRLLLKDKPAVEQEHEHVVSLGSPGH